MDSFWQNVDQCLDEIEKCKTVDQVIDILNKHFDKSSGEAFFGGSGGDRQLRDALDEAGWTITWAEADYYYVARDTEGNLLTYTEGDVDRGDTAIRSG